MTAQGAAVAVLAVGALPLGACSDGDDQADEGVIGSDRDTEGHGLERDVPRGEPGGIACPSGQVGVYN